MQIKEMFAKDNISDMSYTNIALSREDRDAFETSWNFKRHPPLPTIDESSRWEDKNQNSFVNEDEQREDYTDEELEFAVFCIENIAEYLGVEATLVCDALTRRSDIMEQYIIPCYESLHTQGKEYIVEDILEVMKERGVTV